jgi:hypothetical protein
VRVTPDEAAAVFAAFGNADDYESLMWRVDMREGMGRDMRLYAQCSDVFSWATADAEEITAADVPLLESCLTDLGKAGAAYYLAELFAARKRKLRPQKPFYKDMPEDVAALFDACCTEEERADADKRDAAWWVAGAHKIKNGAATGEGEVA